MHPVYHEVPGQKPNTSERIKRRNKNRRYELNAKATGARLTQTNPVCTFPELAIYCGDVTVVDAGTGSPVA